MLSFTQIQNNSLLHFFYLLHVQKGAFLADTDKNSPLPPIEG